MAITRGQMQRQLRRGGGIMDVTPREQFGLGSSLKKFVRKVIPNEVSKVATIAAPFVAPFNPALAGAMAGIGSFDQTGSLSDAFKRGALTYGGGQAARFIGGAGFQGNPFTAGGAFTPSGFTTGFSSPIGTQTGIGKLLEGVKGVGPARSDMSKFNQLGLGGSNPAGIAGNRPDLTLATGDGAAMEAVFKNVTPTSVSEAVSKTAGDASKGVFELVKEGRYPEAAVEAGKKALKSVFLDKDGNLDKTALLAAGSFGLTYLDAKKIADDAGVDIGTETEYDEATKDEFKEKYSNYLTNFFGGKKDGGRIGFGNGSIVVSEDELAEMGGLQGLQLKLLAEKFMKQGMSESSAYEKAANQLYADGGRVSFNVGSPDPKSKPNGEYKETPFYGDFRDELLEILEELKKMDKDKKAQGGRIGFRFGDKAEDKEGIMSMFKLINRPDDDKEKLEEIEGIKSMSEDENTKMAYFPGDVFSKAEISRLFRDKSLTTNQDRKQLFKILMNPGMFPEAEEMLKKMLRGKQDGGRIGFESGANKKFKFMELIEDDTDEKEKLINALLDNAREKFPEASEEDIFNFVMSKAAPMSGLMVDGKFVRSTDIETPSIKLSRDMGGPRYDFLMGGEVPVRKNKAGIEELDYRQTGGFVPVGVKEKADDVPAMLSKNEFVLTADAVRGIGGGDVEKGAEKLYGVMKQAEKVGRA